MTFRVTGEYFCEYCQRYTTHAPNDHDRAPLTVPDQRHVITRRVTKGKARRKPRGATSEMEQEE
jgi:hypothetical protein